MIEQITTLVELLDLLSLDHRIILREGNEPVNRLRALREMGDVGNNDGLLLAMSTVEPVELFRVFAALSLQPQTLTSDQITRLHEFLLNDESISLKTAVARQLRLATEPTVINKLFDTLVRCNDPQVRSVIAYALAENATADWKGKIGEMLIVFRRYKYHREHMDYAALLTAIRPSVDILAQNRFLLTDHLIHKTVSLTDDIERVTGILAGLIIESVGHNLNRANQRLGEYEYAHDEPAMALILLRSEMNSLLTPAERQSRLEETFSDPLRKAHDEIHAIWESSIKNVERSLRSRRGLGAIGFGVGLLALLAAVIMIVIQNGNGYWLALIGITTLAITAVYSGPVRNSKEVLTEIGTANAVYTAYVQRTLEISNAYSHLYLQDKLTYTELERSNQLISAAMNDTVKALRTEGKTSFEDFINQLR